MKVTVNTTLVAETEQEAKILAGLFNAIRLYKRGPQSRRAERLWKLHLPSPAELHEHEIGTTLTIRKPPPYSKEAV